MYTKKLTKCGLFLLPAFFAFNANAINQGQGRVYDVDAEFEAAAQGSAAQSCSQQEWQTKQCAEQVEVEQPLRRPSCTAPKVVRKVKGRKGVEHQYEQVNRKKTIVRETVEIVVNDADGEEQIFELPFEKAPPYMPAKCWTEVKHEYQGHAQECKKGNSLGLVTERVMKALPDRTDKVTYAMKRVERDGKLIDVISFTAIVDEEEAKTWSRDDGESNMTVEEIVGCLDDMNLDVGQALCAAEEGQIAMPLPERALPGSRHQAGGRKQNL